MSAISPPSPAVPEPAGGASTEIDLAAPAVEITARSIMLGAGPRFARDAFGPALSFYIGWRVAGLVVGIAVATAMSVGLWLYERRRDRKNTLAWLSLLVVGIQAVVGLAADDAKAFLAPQVLVTAAWSLAFLGSVALRRPLAALFAGEIYPFPPDVRASLTFRTVFTRVSLAWGVVMGLRAILRWITLSYSVEGYLLTSLLTGIPITVATLTWSVWYGTRTFRRSEEWGWAFEAAEQPSATT